MKDKDLIASEFMARLFIAIALMDIIMNIMNNKEKSLAARKRELKHLLNKHVDNENYEETAKIRDMINNIKE